MAHSDLDARGGRVILLTGHGSVLKVAMQGAQVLSWTPNGTDRDVFWCSSQAANGGGKAIRGGIPICWPWFGPHARDPSRPQHGFARNIDWVFDTEITAAHGAAARLSLSPAAMAAFSPEHALAAAVDLICDDRHSLTLVLTSINLGTSPAPLSFALHAYFAVSDVDNVTIEGLDGATFRDNSRGGVSVMQRGAMRIDTETIALFDDAPSPQVIVDTGWARRIIVARAGAGSTIVWNPGANVAALADVPAAEGHRFVCVESGLIGSRAPVLAPGERHRFAVTYQLG